MPLKPKVVTVADDDGEEKTFTIYKFDCDFGREIYAQYAISALPKVGEYSVNRELAFRAMHYVSVMTGDKETFLTTETLVRNHITDWKMFTSLEQELGAHNFSFFTNGKAFNFLDAVAQILIDKSLLILTPLLQQYLTAVSQPSTNSEQSTPSKTE